MKINLKDENIVRTIAIIILSGILLFFFEFKIIAYCLIGGMIAGYIGIIIWNLLYKLFEK